MTETRDELQEPDDEGRVVDQEAADVAAGPASGVGDTAGAAMGAAEDAEPGHPATAMGAGSEGEDNSLGTAEPTHRTG